MGMSSFLDVIKQYIDRCLSTRLTVSFSSHLMNSSVAVWSANKKKPLCVVEEAHGRTTTITASGEEVHNPNWITTVSCCFNTDLVATGSHNGQIKLWKLNSSSKSSGSGGVNLEEVASVAVDGFINGIEIAKSGRLMVAGVSQEHRFGRWRRISSARNGIAIVPLLSSSPSEQ